MSLDAIEFGIYKRAHKFNGQFTSDHPASKAKHVHVIVLHTLMSRVGVVAESSPNPDDFVRRH
jgi:hypothetical protein